MSTTEETQLSKGELARIAESFENLNDRLDRYDKTLTNTLVAISLTCVLFLAGAGLASVLY